MAAASTSSRATTATVSRTTKEGRSLRYVLCVIQQPERARACGSGAKSSADRRPVDPPPVVELRIYCEDEDVTFSYNANFFLFATLEVTRPIAHGRVHTSAPQVPVLTGMPVSGMAYLDRPSEAGYFIFPDLSVRHEGHYQLSFNLYEETKDAKDADADPSSDASKAKLPNGAAGPDASSFDWRLEVKSLPFVVYSAKKFPGLAESTTLSRTVAEQGCRVRIRRDVRMRRRDSKPGDDAGEEDYSARPGRPAVPDHEGLSQRSLSNDGDEARQLHLDTQRRLSAEYPSQQYQNQYPLVHPTLNPTAPPKAYLDFGQAPGGAQYQAPPPPPPPPQFAQPQPQPPAPHSYPPAPIAYHQESHYGQPRPGSYGPSDRQSFPLQYSATNPVQRESRENYVPEVKRASHEQPPLSVPQGNFYSPVDPNYHNRNVSSYHAYHRPHSPSMRSPTPTLAPMKLLPRSRAEIPSSPLASIAPPPLPAQDFDHSQDRSRLYNHYSKRLAESSEPSRHSKRPYHTVFNSSAANQPLYNGMRPSGSYNGTGLFDDDDDDTMSIEDMKMKMSYKRADGSSYSRELPTLE
ncbi:hypothetical protein B7494_g6651 [Chlorociboria aeruginascens]|nr:hypothetical protein B7494_g6651 [Chlorociboria aeruginascens]